jgi:serine O-acetyltransferase
MTVRRLRYLIYTDLYRYGSRGASGFLKQFLRTPAFNITFWFRVANFLSRNRKFLPLALIAREILRRKAIRFGVELHHTTEIGPGFRIGHIGGIVINHRTKIGANCTVMQGVTLGKSSRGKYAGYPTIEDDVYLSPGAKVAGAVTVGKGAMVAPNSFVNRDVPPNGVVLGVPSQVVSETGSEGYVTKTDYLSEEEWSRRG